MKAIVTFLESSLGGGYRTSTNSTVTPLTFSQFVDQIGCGTQGGIYHLIFIAEMQGRTIEVFDRTSDHSLRRQYGTGHLKMDPFVFISHDPIRIKRIGEEGAYHYRPLSADGTAIDVASNSPYANRCLFDAIAYQLRVSTDTLISRFQAYLLDKNLVAQELYEENIQDIFPELIGGARRPRPDTPNKKPLILRRTVQGNQETVTATVRYGDLYQSTPATVAVRTATLDNSLRGWDHAGHILANVLGGPGNNIQNFEPMQKLLNMGEFKSFELQLRNQLTETQHGGLKSMLK